MDAAGPTPPSSRTGGDDHVFDDIVVGIDETPESLVAAAQAQVLRTPGGRLAVIAVAEQYLSAHAGFAAADAEGKLAAETSAVLDRARELVQADEARLVAGRLVDVVRGEGRRRGVTLIAIGARPHRRLAAATFGGHDVEFLHHASCGVLIARAGWGPSRPASIVVGIDNSPSSRAAETVARALAARLGSEIVPVVSLQHVDLSTLRAERDDGVLDPRDLVHAVAAAATERSLVVVGRGRLTERIAYSARCSVLVLSNEA